MQGVVLDAHSTLVLKTTFSVDHAVSESAYFFPLNSDVALYGLRATIQPPSDPPRIIVGKVLEKEAARRGFSTAVSEGRPAALLEVGWCPEFVFT